jgi:hypothetical protein
MSPAVLAAGGLLLAAGLLGLFFGFELKGFLSRTPELASAVDLAAFRRIVARQMYGALAAMVLAATAAGIAVFGLFQRSIRVTDLFPVLIIGMALLPVGIWCKAIEARAKAISAGDESLRRQRDEVVDTWMRKPLPDW